VDSREHRLVSGSGWKLSLADGSQPLHRLRTVLATGIST
jgi:hypothetical protein